MRTRVKLAFIENNSARKSSSKKRINGLLKKMTEISTLCGILACAIIYGPDDVQPWLWPNNPKDMESLIEQFLRRNGYDKTWKKLDQKGFLCKFIGKSEQQLEKLQKEIKHIEMKETMFQCLAPGSTAMKHFDLDDVGDVLWLIDELLNSIEVRTMSLNQSAPSSDGAAAKDAVMHGGDVAVHDENPQGDREGLSEDG